MWVRIVAMSVVALLVMSVTPALAQDEPRLSSIVEAEADIAPDTERCFPGMSPGQTDVQTCRYGERGPHILAIGDSHLRALSPAFRRLAEEGRIRLTLVIRSRCGWSSRRIDHDERWIRDECQTWRANVAQFIRSQDDVRAIVTTHRASTMPGTPAQRGPDVARAWRVALERDIPVIAISGAANWPFSGPMPTECLRRHPEPSQWGRCAAPAGRVLKFDWTIPAVETARREYGNHAAFRIDLDQTHCPGGTCRVVTRGGQIMYRDHQHLTATYTRSLAPLFLRRLRATGVVFPERTAPSRSGVRPTCPENLAGWTLAAANRPRTKTLLAHPPWHPEIWRCPCGPGSQSPSASC